MKAIELINIICPEHCRTSCDDCDLSNSWCNQDHEPFNPNSEFYNHRCNRCALLSLLNGMKLQDNKKFNCFVEIEDK